MAGKGAGIFLVYTDVESKHEDEFNDWYNTEHLPELLAVPGILAAARYEAVKGGPKYLAAYEIENTGVLETPEFRNRPRTPWGGTHVANGHRQQPDPRRRPADLPGAG